MGKKETGASKSSKKLQAKLEKRELEERGSFNESTKVDRAFNENSMKDKKDRRAKRSSNRLHAKFKKRKLKEKGSFDESNEVDKVYHGDSLEGDILEYGLAVEVDLDVQHENVESLQHGEVQDRVSTLKKHESTRPGEREKKGKLTSKKKRREKRNEVDAINADQLSQEDDNRLNGLNYSDIAKISCKSKTWTEIASSAGLKETNIGTKVQMKKVKKAGRSKKKDLHVSLKERKLKENVSEVDGENVDQISSVDEDCSRGMKKWLIEYKQNRPGLKILQQRIDEFITTYEAQQEQARKEREAQVAEGGWTVVVHHKGRKKTTDSESGITVGSVAQAAVMDKIAKKKNKEVDLDFYGFQRRESRRNEVMMLQSKFEQDRKRIQQLRAARKFRPY